MDQQMQALTLRNLFSIVRAKLIVVILIPIIVTVTMGFVNYYYLKNIYCASTTLMVVKTQTAINPLEYSQLLANRQLVPTYSEIAKSRSVATKVLDISKVNISYEQYQSMVNVQMVKDTELIQINIEDSLPWRAKLLANATAAAFMQTINLVMQFDNVKVIDTAITPSSPVKPHRMLNMLISFLLSTVASILLVFIFEYMDNTLKDKEDVEKFLDLPVIGSIPKV